MIINVLKFTNYLTVKHHNEEDNKEKEKEKEKEEADKFYAPFDVQREAELTEPLGNPRKLFKIQNVVGTGGFGTVCAAMMGNKKIAIKKCSYVSEKEKKSKFT